MVSIHKDEAQRVYRKRLATCILLAAVVNVLLVLFVPGFRQAVKESLKMISLTDEWKTPALPPPEPPTVKVPKVKFTPIAGMVSGLAPVSSDSGHALDGPGLNIGPMVRTPDTSKPIPMQSLDITMIPGDFSGSVLPTARSVLDRFMPVPSEMQGAGRIAGVPLPSDFDITSEINSILPSGPVSPPSATKRVQPVYPEEARLAGIEGEVVLKVVIQFDGTIGDVEVLESSGRDDFDQAAIECVRQWEFKPAMQSGIRVTMAARVTISFEIVND